MFKRLMQCLMALLVAVMFGAMPTLSLASPATASPPMVATLAPEVAQVASNGTSTIFSIGEMQMQIGSSATLEKRCTFKATPRPVLLE